MQGEDPVEVAELQHSPYPRLADHQPKIPVEQTHPLERTDQHAESERIDIVDSPQVENQVPMAVRNRTHHLLAKFGRADNVEFTGDRENAPGTLDVGVHDDVHRSHGIGRHPWDSATDPS